MTAERIDGKAIAEKIHAETKAICLRLKKQNSTPRLLVVLVGANPASQMYCRMKGVAARLVGIDFKLIELPASTTETALINELARIQKAENPSGLILQLPLPEVLYTPRVLNSIDATRDVDFLTNHSLGSLIMNTAELLPPTPGAIIKILDERGIDVRGKNVTVVGTGSLVGKPLAIILMNRGASVTTVNSRTQDTKTKCLMADILISGVGKKDLIRGDMVKPGAVVLDAGIAFENKKVFGDVTMAEVELVASSVTPTPGGVGPITVALLLYNTARLAERATEQAG